MTAKFLKTEQITYWPYHLAVLTHIRAIHTITSVSGGKESYHTRVPHHLPPVLRQKSSQAVGHWIQSEEELGSSETELHFPHQLPLIRGYPRRQNEASQIAAADWEVLWPIGNCCGHDKALKHEMEAASTRGSRLPWLQDARDSP